MNKDILFSNDNLMRTLSEMVIDVMKKETEWILPYIGLINAYNTQSDKWTVWLRSEISFKDNIFEKTYFFIEKEYEQSVLTPDFFFVIQLWT